MRLIDADALLENVFCINDIYGTMFVVKRGVIQRAPTIEAELVRHGKWVEHPYEREWDVCSCCKIGTKRREFGMTDEGREWVTEESYAYCPWCGAKMEEQE